MDIWMKPRGSDCSLFVHKEEYKRQEISFSCNHPSNCTQTLCVGNAAISYIVEGLTRHLWPRLTSPSCASAAETLLHPTHFKDWCQRCKNIYFWNWKASFIQEPLPALCMSLILYEKGTGVAFQTIMKWCIEMYRILTKPCLFGTYCTYRWRAANPFLSMTKMVPRP